MRAPFELLIQHPQAKSFGHGSLNMDKAGDAQFFGGDNGDGPPLASMTRVRVEHAAAHGILYRESNSYPLAFVESRNCSCRNGGCDTRTTIQPEPTFKKSS